MNDPKINEFCYNPNQAEAFFDQLAEELGFSNKQVHGRLVNKQFDGKTIEVDRRYFEYENDRYQLYVYSFTKNIELEDLPYSLRAKLLRKDFVEIEAANQKNTEIRKFYSEPFFGLGYQTPIDQELVFDWGQVGCLAEMPSRTKKSQFKGDLVTSMKHMDSFDKNARIKGELVKWFPKTDSGFLKTDLVKKVFIDRRKIPYEVKNPQPGLKLNLRITRHDGKKVAHDVQMG
jgi:hypothetical protein